MATGTYFPAVPQQYFDNSGNPLAAGTLETFIAGTTTHLATFSDAGLTVPNANPMTLDASGRPQAGYIFATPGLSYKAVWKDSTGATMTTPDNVLAIPPSSATLDITGTAGETLTAGQLAYLSDGSGAKTAGQWFKADSGSAYSSTTPEIGIIPANISSGSSGTVRLLGQNTGMSSLTVGALYYVGTAGAVTITPPANARLVGQADSTTSLIVTPNPPPPLTVDNGICDFRLTLTTALPVTTADVTAATTIFCTPMRGNRIALFSSAGAPAILTSAEFSIAVPATTATVYDIFAFNNSGVATLELLAWTNDTTRATAVVLTTTGTYTKSGDLTRRYLGSFRTTAVSGQTEDSGAKRDLWNYYNRVPRPFVKPSADTTWNYTTATVRQANASTANQVEAVIGIAEVPINLWLTAFVNNANNVAVQIGIGEDSTSTISTSSIGGGGVTSTGAVFPGQNLSAQFVKYPAVGRHVYSWNEWSAVGGVSAWYGTPSSQSGLTGTANGISGWIEG